MVLFIWLILAPVQTKPVNIQTIYLQEQLQTNQKINGNADISARTVAVDIFIPSRKKVEADLLVLPGWNFSKKRWQNETDILKYCDENRYRCFFPEMGVTLYESQYFPETTMKWAAMPGGEWVRQVLIPELQKKGFLKNKKKNFLLGLSTGGRGVALLSLQNPGMFAGGAALSGDFNQAEMVKDRLITAVYGSYVEYKERWQAIDNPQVEVSKGKWNMPLYIGHGKQDKIIPFEQSLRFFETLKLQYPELKMEFSQPENASHDFSFWNSQLGNVFAFFKQL